MSHITGASTPLKFDLSNLHFSVCCFLGLLIAGPLHAQQPDSALVAIVRDYTGLYTRESFDQWTRLFSPGFSSANSNPAGGTTTRTLTQFLDAQRQGFIRAKEMRETLENVRIEQRGRLASIWSDFTFFYDGTPSRGKLVLLAIADSAGWKFHSLMFAYDK